jgi:MFS transporter, Spinster family, sphingosine-1-phosphate transporter
MISNQMKIFSLVILTSMNVVNYLDRFIISALLPSIQADLHLNDTQLGLLHTAFTFSYILSAPILGFLGDRIVRKWLASGAVFLWSIATGLSGIAGSYRQLLGIRSMVGIGEAGYGPVAPTIISDYYSENVRSRMLSIYYVGTPLGSALGLMLGGVLGHYYGWRTAFLVAAIPGVFLAVLALWIKEPPRSAQQIQNPSIAETFRFLKRTPSYIYNLFGTAAMTFATGGLAYWFPTFLFRMRGWHLTSATQFFGAITVIAGIAGTLFGGFIADLWQNKNRKSYFYVSALGMLVAAPCAVGAILIQNRAWVFPLVFLAEFFLFFNMGPLNAAIISVVHPKMRATAMALNILFIHLLGDAVSTWVIGKVSDMTHSLTAGVLIGPVAILLGGIILMSGASRLAEDQLKLDAELKKV